MRDGLDALVDGGGVSGWVDVRFIASRRVCVGDSGELGRSGLDGWVGGWRWIAWFAWLGV